MEITNYREQPPASKIVVIFDVYISAWQLTFRNLKLIRSSKGHNFVVFPSFCEDIGGQKKYTPYIEFSKERGADFQNKIKELLVSFMR